MHRRFPTAQVYLSLHGFLELLNNIPLELGLLSPVVLKALCHHATFNISLVLFVPSYPP